MYPMDDPIIGQASLSILALSLAAIASSIRIFGDEQTEFKRESSTAISTGAYYLGKSISHLFIIVAAPAVFLFAFTSVAGKFQNQYRNQLTWFNSCRRKLLGALLIIHCSLFRIRRHCVRSICHRTCEFGSTSGCAYIACFNDVFWVCRNYIRFFFLRSYVQCKPDPGTTGK